ncbi:Phospholipid and glycerol acyltransferase [Prochlorococcus marinus str. MIT 9321]|uniref:Phospholipid and glycerol acyltransferase n=2 Tax=Prochlorococcaceae TaxID=2881426 RepID=A0A0A2BDZ0_PROMR|nr:Phospholipid and glycerol acyltransferase [Prochlorococcus marinus str. MIT 9322]KGG05945.1 Phospholipid and glycerol acyltransferase [Prochlorococcus marinus str. MIT 9321]KGG10975.1 Phospholipid and glycerol acyltransferase [Prochlorococcus marinus str. MIT 9401]
MKKKSIDTHYGINPLLGFLAMFITQNIVIKAFFTEIKIINKSFAIPKNSSIILAPTHRSRWDGLILTRAMGRRVTNKDCRFMVTKSEMKGIQGWFLKRLGCFPIDQLSPSLSVLRYAVELIEKKNQLVVFPEGKINKYGKKLILKEGLYRLALLAAKKSSSIFIIPIGIAYSQVSPKIRGKASLCFGDPLLVTKNPNLSTRDFNDILYKRMYKAEKIALKNVGR